MVFEEFPSGRYPDSEAAASAVGNGASRLQYTNPRAKKLQEGVGYHSAYSLTAGDESGCSATGLYKHREPVSQARTAKLHALTPFFK